MQYIFSLLLLFLLMQCSSGQLDNGENNDIPIESNDSIVDVDIPINGNDSIEEPETIGYINNKILHIEIARKNIGIPTTDSINMWLSFVNLPPGNPWCAAAQSAWLHQANIKEPLLKTGLARNYIYETPKRLHVSAGRVLAGVVTMPMGSIVVYQRGETIFGHIGTITEDWSGPNGVYISGNTSPPDSGGSEFSGGGVWEKPARIIPSAHLRITDFVYVVY